MKKRIWVVHLRFADVLFAVFEVLAEFGDVQTGAVGLRAHKGECGLEHFVRELFVVRAHAFPEVVDDVLDRDGACDGNASAYGGSRTVLRGWRQLTVWQYLSTGDWDQLLVVRFSLGKRHVLEDIVDQEEDREQSACEVDSVVFRQWKIQTRDVRETGIEKPCFGFGIWKVPVLEKVGVDLFSHLLGLWMVERLPF